MTFGIIILFILSALAPMSVGYNAETSIDDFDRHLLPEYYDSYSVEEIPEHVRPYVFNDNIDEDTLDVYVDDSEVYQPSVKPLDGLMDSAWPMYCHDTRHTGRSPYSTADNPGIEKWRFDTVGWAEGDPVIDSDGVVYIGAKEIYAIYPDGTLKWKYDIPHKIVSAAAIDENGVLYVGNIQDYPSPHLYAIYTSNGTLKWKYNTGGGDIYSSPAIGEDGTIYFSTNDGYWDDWSGSIRALNSNGTLKWRYKTSHTTQSSPAIGEDGTVYCGSHDGNLYALYPNNGTLKWSFHTGDWVARGPSIADDGTIYCGSWDGYFYAVNPDGSLKWKRGSNIAHTTPVIGQDGTIYVGNDRLYAVDPVDGSVKWSFDPGEDSWILASNPCISADNEIFFGATTFIGSSSEGGEIIALNPDGTLKWREMISSDWTHSDPAIGADGTVYIGCSNSDLSDPSWLYAFGYPGPNPLTPDIDGPSSGKPGTSYTYTFTSIDPDNDQVSYYIDWDDGNITDWTDFQPSGDSYSESHTWTTKGTYAIRAKAKDTDGYESDWGTLTVTMPRNRATDNMLLLRFLQQFPLLREVLLRLIPR